MDFNKLHLSEDAIARDAEIQAAEKATAGGQKQIQGTRNRREAQKSQMATQQSQNVKSGVSYASESFHDIRRHAELIKMREDALSDWRSTLSEEEQVALDGPKPEMQQGEGEEEEMHPYVEVMPSTDFKEKEAKRQMKAAAEMEMQAQQGGQMAASAGMAEQVLNEKTMKAANTTWGRKLEKEAKKADDKWKDPVHHALETDEKLMKIHNESKASDAREERRKRPGEKNIKDVMRRINREALPKHMAHQEWLDSLKIHGQDKDVKEGFKEDEIEELRRQHQAREEQKKKLPKYKSAPQSRPSPYGRKKGDPYAPRGGESD